MMYHNYIIDGKEIICKQYDLIDEVMVGETSMLRGYNQLDNSCTRLINIKSKLQNILYYLKKLDKDNIKAIDTKLNNKINESLKSSINLSDIFLEEIVSYNYDSYHLHNRCLSLKEEISLLYKIISSNDQSKQLFTMHSFLFADVALTLFVNVVTFFPIRLLATNFLSYKIENDYDDFLLFTAATFSSMLYSKIKEHNQKPSAQVEYISSLVSDMYNNIDLFMGQHHLSTNTDDIT
jgi:hypothetical protein